jgi:methylated-DNA-[protein]-cysteine S-methyltransferase
MVLQSGSCRFRWWFVHVWWTDDTVHQVRFASHPLAGDVPLPLKRYLAGTVRDLNPLKSQVTDGNLPSARIYRAVREIPYGTTATYGEIAAAVGTASRAVGRAMARNPTPLVVPCHRVVGAKGLGGFTPSVEIKEALLALERGGKKRNLR